VRFLGSLPDGELPLAYRAAELTVVPTVALEGFGLIVVESLAAGTPVLVTPVGGLPETVARLSPCLVLPAAGPASLAEGLCDALAGRLALPDADTCRDYARAHYDWPVIADRIAAAYAEAMW
jgi:glycosyltransferase involved in cell wall biosynthesis